ncbi:MAG: PepSY-associated TM helix domain-containing protein [Proteobacteria bacterium]|nr:PepSY-associated TM helix domain-containing protein [Pseudomonadota bacterium]
MKGGLRPSMAWLHTWSGLLPGWLLYFVFLTGTLGYFSVEIDRWMQPELPLRQRIDPQWELIERGLARLQQRAPGAERWSVELPQRKSPLPPRIVWRMPPTAEGARGEAGTEPLLPADAAPRPRPTGGGQFLYQLHYRLHYIDTQQAYWIIGAAAMFMLVSILSGIILHKKIFTDFFTFRPAAGKRTWRDLHSVLGSIALPFHLMITWSGLVLLAYTYMPLVLDEIYRFDEDAQDVFFTDNAQRVADTARSGVAAPMLLPAQLLARQPAALNNIRLSSYSVRNPGDANARVVILHQRRNAQNGTDQQVYSAVSGQLLDAGLQRGPLRQTRDAMLGLHKGTFAAPLLRALYGLSGALGTVMVGGGLVFWAAKRRERRGGVAGEGAGGLVWVERANPAMLIGPLLGVCTYLLANRLLPVDLEQRGSWEGHALFFGWALALVLTLPLRPPRAWWLLTALLALACAALPVVNVFTTDRHLGVSLPWALREGDWVLAGIDLCLLILALIFAFVARRMARQQC